MLKNKMRSLTALLLCAALTLMAPVTEVQASEWFGIRPNISDADFFGVYNGSAWSNPGLLNYDYSPDLALVEERVKAGDYAGAGEELLIYYKNKKWPYAPSLGSNALMASLTAENVFPFDTSLINSFTMPSNTGWTEYSVDVTGYVNNNRRTISFIMVPLRKDICDISFKTKEADDGDYAPRIDFIIDGQFVSFPIARDGYIHNGDPAATFTNGEVMLSRESGFPIDQSSKRAYLGFDLSGIRGGTVTQAVLRLWGKNDDNSRHSETEVYVYSDPRPDWKEDSEGATSVQKLTWAERAGAVVFSWEGCDPDLLTWESSWHLPYTANPEYGFMVLSRFGFLPDITGMYLRTKDEYYAKNAIRLIMSRYYQRGVDKWHINADPGGYPRSLDAAGGLSAIAQMMPYLSKSSSMEPEYLIEIMKGMWLTSKFLRAEGKVHIVADRPWLGGDVVDFEEAGYHPDGNWGTNETTCLMTASVLFPEFRASEEWIETCVKRFVEFYEDFILPDGAYIEGATLYTGGVLDSLRTLIQLLGNTPFVGTSKDRLMEIYRNFAWAYRDMRSSDDIPVMWGDSDLFSSEKNSMTAGGMRAALLTGDPGLLYVITNGKEGAKPVFRPLSDEAMAALEAKDAIPVGWPGQNPDVEFTTNLFPFKMTLSQRSGWLDGNAYLFCELDGGAGGHNHPDDLQVVVSAYGRMLLVDSGRFNYVGSDPVQQFLRLTTTSHNTVTVNNRPQSMLQNGGIRENNRVHYFTSNNMFDFFEGTTTANDNTFKMPNGLFGPGDHTRSIAFIKPAYWVVTDKVTPSDGSVVNYYEQNWHTSGNFYRLSGSNMQGGATSNSDGINMQVVGVYNPDITVALNDGFYAPNSTQSMATRYLTFKQEKAGTVWYNTVLYPTRSGDLTQVTTQPLSTLYAGSSCAFTIQFNNEKSYTEDIYFISMADKSFVRPQDEFDRYRFDGKTAHIQKNAQYETSVASIVDGTYLIDDGIEIIGSDERITDFSVEWASTAQRASTAIEMSTSMDLSKRISPIRIYAPADNYKWITLNGKNVDYTRNGDYILLGGQ